MRYLLSRHSFLIAAIAVLPVITQAAGIQVMIGGQSLVFGDVQTAMWFAPFVREAAEAGIVTGYKDGSGRLTGKYGPGNTITLAEALKIASEGAGYDEELYGSIVDSGMSSHWANVYVSVAKSEQFPVFAASARIDRPASRAEVASLFASAFRADVATASPVDTRYTDVTTTTSYAAAIEALSRDGIIAGDTDIHAQSTGTFRPNANINRAEVAKMVIKARAKYGTPGIGRGPSQSSEDVVTYTAAGFSPSALRVQIGTTVSFRNDSGGDLRVASNPHPAHTDLSGFDALDALSQGEVYTFTFTRRGTFGYHNHLHPQHGATIIVE